MLAALRPSALFTAAVIATSGLAVGSCGGPAFTNSDASGKGGVDGDGGFTSSSGGASSGDGGRAGASGASTSGASSSGGAHAGGGGSGSSTGGARAGGAGGTSSTGGVHTGGTGGLTGLGGLGVGGLVGLGGALGASFPSTPVLDHFARPNGALGDSWRGATDEFALRDEQLIDTTDAGQPLLWDKSFGANQEVFATLVSFAAEAREINLVMKAQEPGNPCKLIEVLYEPDRAQIGVDYCLNERDWTELEPFSATLAPGDQLGARATANGKLMVYRNGELITTFDISGFPYASGRIGVNALSIPEDPATWDVFGGGNSAP